MDFVQGSGEMLANGSERGGNWGRSGGGFQELSCLVDSTSLALRSNSASESGRVNNIPVKERCCRAS